MNDETTLLFRIFSRLSTKQCGIKIYIHVGTANITPLDKVTSKSHRNKVIKYLKFDSDILINLPKLKNVFKLSFFGYPFQKYGLL